MGDVPMTDETRVSALLDAAGLQPSPAERAAFITVYPMLRAMVASLYAVPDARYESPALAFDARPVFDEWPVRPPESA